MEKKYHIPQHLDEPFKIILWTVDEICVLLIPFVLSMVLFNVPLIGLLTGVGLMFILKKIKGEQGHYFIFNVMYWYLPSVMRFRAIPPSHLREWIG